MEKLVELVGSPLDTLLGDFDPVISEADLVALMNVDFPADFPTIEAIDELEPEPIAARQGDRRQ